MYFSWNETKQTLKLAIPIILGQLGNILMQAVDTAMIGRIDQGAVLGLAAAAFAGNLCNFLLILGIGASTALHVLVSQAAGSKVKQKEKKPLLVHGMWFVFVYGLALALLLTLKPELLGLLHQPEEVVVAAKTYTIYLIWSNLFALLFMCLKSYSEASQRPWEPLTILLSCIGVNGFLNWIFIFGHFGFDAMGLPGAGLATLIARVITIIALWIFMENVPQLRLKLGLGSFFSLSWDYFKRILSIGIPSSLQLLFEWGSFIIVTFMMGQFGATALAAHQIVQTVGGFMFMVPLGLTFAITIRTSEAYGQGNVIKAARIGSSGIIFAASLMTSIGLSLLFMRYQIPKLFVNTLDPANFDMIQLVVKFFMVIAVFQLFDSTQATTIGTLRGLNDIKIPMVFAFIGYILVGLPTSYILAFTCGFQGIGLWIGEAIGLGVTSILLILRFRFVIR
ncbi:MAG: hypothetical protein A2007_04820 [Verrucomicrobia bacterium GWC2_42_7]|nr:MAG: hypothetical protein A2007_04820 [Verrucomicrobia bacterium GWC2_42_7]